MGKKASLGRPKSTKGPKTKFTQKKTHSQKNPINIYSSGNQTSPKSKNSQTAIYYDDSEDPPSSQTKSSELRKAQAIHLLSGSQYPKQFKYRQRQLGQINTFVTECLKKQKKGCRFLMITGAPGLGKTLSVTTILSRISCLVISLNSNVITTLKEVQDIIYENLIGRKSEKPLTTDLIIRELIAAKKTQPVFIYVEEIQTALNGCQSDYDRDFLSLFSNKQLNICLIGVSNSIDALERYNAKVYSLYKIKNLVFTPYSDEVLQKITLDRLNELNQRCQIRIDISDKLLKYASRKLGLLTKGDMRMVNEFIKDLASSVINEQQLENQEQEQSKQNCEFNIAIDCLNNIFRKMENSKESLIQSLPFTQQLLLCGISQTLVQQELLYLSQDRIYTGMTIACSDAGIYCSKNKIKLWLEELECYSLVKIDERKDRQVRITLCVDRKQLPPYTGKKQTLRGFLSKMEHRL